MGALASRLRDYDELVGRSSAEDAGRRLTSAEVLLARHDLRVVRSAR